MAKHNQRHVESKSISRASLLIAALAVLTLTVISHGDASPSPAPATNAAQRQSSAEPVRTAGLLVPKRVRLIIKYQRTALV